MWGYRFVLLPRECGGIGGFGAGPPYLQSIAHDRFGSSSDPNLNGHLHYPNDIDRSLNETVTDKIRKYRADYNNKPPNIFFFMVVVVSTFGRLHSEFVIFLFLQAHRETDRFFAVEALRITLNIDRAPILSQTHTHPSHL
jgi:hypothetical protein